MKPPPTFQFYVTDFIEGTAHMTNSEVGLYWRLLCAQWTRGGLPNNDGDLIRFGRGSYGVRRDLAAVKTKFEVCCDGLLRNHRLEIERTKQNSYREQQSRKGQQSGISRRAAVQPRLPSGSSPVRTEREPKANSLSLSSSKKEALSGKASYRRRFSEGQLELACRFEKALGAVWKKDRFKWNKRVRDNRGLSERVITEVEDAMKGSRIKTTPAQYAEFTWEQFK